MAEEAADQRFEERGRRWAQAMRNRLRAHWLEIPLVWPGTREQALTIVHAFTDDSLEEVDRARLAVIVQNGARSAWREMLSDAQTAATRAAPLR